MDGDSFYDLGDLRGLHYCAIHGHSSRHTGHNDNISAWPVNPDEFLASLFVKCRKLEFPLGL